jgi:hypothetical protein
MLCYAMLSSGGGRHCVGGDSFKRRVETVFGAQVLRVEWTADMMLARRGRRRRGMLGLGLGLDADEIGSFHMRLLARCADG